MLSEFKKTTRDLRVLVPPVWPITVRRLKLPESDHGDCTFVRDSKKGPHFIIRLNRELSEDALIFALIHEWAHALSWGSDSHRIAHHGPEWGLAISRIWQALLED